MTAVARYHQLWYLICSIYIPKLVILVPLHLQYHQFDYTNAKSALTESRVFMTGVKYLVGLEYENIYQVFVNKPEDQTTTSTCQANVIILDDLYRICGDMEFVLRNSTSDAFGRFMAALYNATSRALHHVANLSHDHIPPFLILYEGRVGASLGTYVPAAPRLVIVGDPGSTPDHTRGSIPASTPSSTRKLDPHTYPPAPSQA